jgi:hypothetical protein
MATTTPTDVTEDAASNVYALRDRIITLLVEGNTDGAAELSQEAETIISGIKGRAAAVTSLKRTLRAAIAEANKTKPKVVEAPAEDVSLSAEVMLARAAEVAKVEAEIDKAVNLGAEEIKGFIDQRFNGARRIAALLFDMRLRFIHLENGTPDIMGSSKRAKDASSEMFNRVTAGLPAKGTDEVADSMRSEVKKLAKNVQNEMIDLRVAYARSLDGTTDEAKAERELYAGIIDADSDKPVSEQFAEHYGFKLQTKAELAKARRDEAKAKADEAAAEAAEGEGDESSADAAEQVERTPAEAIRYMVDNVANWTRAADAFDDEEITGSLAEASDGYKAALVEDLNAQIAALHALVALIEA